MDTALRFFALLMHNQHIPVHRFAAGLAPVYDLGLRETIGLDYPELLPEADSLRHNTVYFISDAFGWKYVFLRLPETEDCLLTGPYLTESVSDPFIMALMEQRKIPAELLPTLRNYYKQVTLLPSESFILSAVAALGEMLWGSTEDFSTEFRTIAPTAAVSPADVALDSRRSTAERQLIEARYEAESRLMYAVSHGQMHQAAMVLSSFNIAHFEQRTADPLRNMKNYLIVFNTLMRKAAQQGSVHPLYIDQLSSTLALQIEQLVSVEAGTQMLGRMVHKYCLLVKNHNMTQYSQPVQSVILRVDTELSGDLSLSAHAAAIGVNASYLSSLFKKETGQTLTEYVTRRRIDYAIFLLNTSDMQIQTIAQHCGIPDVNYFTRSFRKVTGLTPTEYRAGIKGGKK
ncbi:MAG: helix-turn-helix transcriptional regulator [Clostridia bacterium]|nr:helix-turn-helix transcriptional regulator [Clostridia bacterium]